MANIEVVSVCNMNCPYCFAGAHMHEVKAQNKLPFISLEVFEQRLDFLDRSAVEQVRLIGGEPSLHPQFPELVRRVQLRKKPIMVFSHGIMPERALAALEQLSPDECTVLINMNAIRGPQGDRADDQARRIQTIRRLGQRALLGYTIYTTNFGLEWLLPIIREANCRKMIRVGLAHPILFGQNDYLHPKQYPIVGAGLVAFCELAAKDSVALDFDCGFVRCMFSDADIDTLRRANTQFGWHCGPILDVDIQGNASHCFPLAGTIEIATHADASVLRNELQERTQLYRTAGIYRECSSCAYKQSGECSGGGMEHIMRRFRRTSVRLAVPAAAIYNNNSDRGSEGIGPDILSLQTVG
jgi:hypothetical protein